MTNGRILATRQSGEWILTYDVRDDPANTVSRVKDTGDGHTVAFVGELDVQFGRWRDDPTPGGWSLDSVRLFWYPPGGGRAWIRTTSVYADSTWVTREVPQWVRAYAYAACVEVGADPPYLRCSPWNETCAPNCRHMSPSHLMKEMRSAAVQEVVNDTPWAGDAQAWLDAYERGEGR